MSKAAAIKIINRCDSITNDTKQMLRNLMDEMYADTAASIGDIVIVSADAGNDITEGTDGGAFYDAVP